MIDINYIINQEILKERYLARKELASELLHKIGCPKGPAECIEKIGEIQERLFKVEEEYAKFISGIPF